MMLRSLGWAAMPALVAVVLAGSAQTASAGATSVHQYRLNEFTGDTDDFGSDPLVPIAAAVPDADNPQAPAAPTGRGPRPGQVPALGRATADSCRADASGTITRLCPSYAFGFSQGVTVDSSVGPTTEAAGISAIVIEMLLFDGGGRRKVHDF